MEPMYEARETYLTHLQQLLQDNPPEGRDELEYIREQLAQLDAHGARR